MTDSRWLNELSKTYVGELNEATRKTEKVTFHDAVRDLGEYNPTAQGFFASGKGAKRGRQVDVIPGGGAIVGVSNQTQIGDAHELADGEADRNNIYKTGKPLKVNKRQILKPMDEQAEYISDLEELVEQQLQEHEDYISTLETMLALVVEEFDIDVESLVEAAKKPMPKKPMASKPSAAALRYLKLSRAGEGAAARGTGGSKSAVAARTAALKKLEQVASTAAGRNALKRFG